MGVMRRNIPAEVKAFKEQFFFGLTVRQLVCGALILALAVPTGIFGSRYFSQDTIGWIIILEVAPLAAVGWASYNDMPIEKIGKKAFAYYFGVQKRKFKYETKESVLHKKLKDIELEISTSERNDEIKAEKERIKAEKKALRKSAKQAKKAKNKKKEDEIL